ncbi:MAG: ABC transporter permease subunit, partial [Epsilonproteobacteria bacterium]|nr:ABC transporter permease subunit [Campylobacterota bacterium]
FPHVRGSLIFAAISLAILILPYIVKLSLSGILNIPKEYIYLALSLGAKERDLIFKIYLRYSKGYIMKSLLLAYARAIEDTAVIMLTGAVASYGIVGSLFEPFEALSYKIYFLLSIDGNIENSKVYMLASILILIGTILVYISNKKGDLFDRVNRF